MGADLWKGFGLIVVVTLWRRNWRRAATAVSLTWLVCLAFSVSSAIGIYVQERTAMTSGREAKHASYAEMVKELAELEARSKALGVPRPSAQVEAMIAGVLTRPVTSGDRVRGTVGTLSDNCTRTDLRTAADCVELAALRADLAAAVEARRVEMRAADLRQQLTVLREHGSSAAPDPVGEFWAWLLRGSVSVKDVGFGLPLAFALMIEMVSTFGPLGIVSYAEATRTPTSTDASRHVGAERDVAGRVQASNDVGSVVHYMTDRTEPSAGSAAVDADQLHGDYQQWCVSQRVQPLSLQDFVDEFDRLRGTPELAGRINKSSGQYVGIALVVSGTTALSHPGSD